MSRRRRYADYEVGAGWIDPTRLGERLMSGFRVLGLSRSHGGSPGWLGPAALTLVILSLWSNEPVKNVVVDLVNKIARIFT